MTNISGKSRREKEIAYSEVPNLADGLPMIIASDTPVIASFLPTAAASNRWSVVFSKDASISTLSFIFATPKRVMPRTSPFRKIISKRLAQVLLAGIPWWSYSHQEA